MIVAVQRDQHAFGVLPNGKEEALRPDARAASTNRLKIPARSDRRSSYDLGRAVVRGVPADASIHYQETVHVRPARCSIRMRLLA